MSEKRDDFKFIDSVIKAAKNGVALEHLTTMASAYYHKKYSTDEKDENRPTCVRCFKPLEGAREDIGTRMTCYKCLGQISFSFAEEEEDNAERNQSK